MRTKDNYRYFWSNLWTVLLFYLIHQMGLVFEFSMDFQQIFEQKTIVHSWYRMTPPRCDMLVVHLSEHLHLYVHFSPVHYTADSFGA